MSSWTAAIVAASMPGVVHLRETVGGDRSARRRARAPCAARRSAGGMCASTRDVAVVDERHRSDCRSRRESTLPPSGSSSGGGDAGRAHRGGVRELRRGRRRDGATRDDPAAPRRARRRSGTPSPASRSDPSRGRGSTGPRASRRRALSRARSLRRSDVVPVRFTVVERQAEAVEMAVRVGEAGEDRWRSTHRSTRASGMRARAARRQVRLRRIDAVFGVDQRSPFAASDPRR